MPYSSKALVAAAIVCLSASHAAAQTAVADTRLNVRSGPGPAFGIVTVILGGSGALLLYLLFARALKITELTELLSGLRTRLRR